MKYLNLKQFQIFGDGTFLVHCGLCLFHQISHLFSEMLHEGPKCPRVFSCFSSGTGQQLYKNNDSTKVRKVIITHDSILSLIFQFKVKINIDKHQTQKINNMPLYFKALSFAKLTSIFKDKRDKVEPHSLRYSRSTPNLKKEQEPIKIRRSTSR